MVGLFQRAGPFLLGLVIAGAGGVAFFCFPAARVALLLSTGLAEACLTAASLYSRLRGARESLRKANLAKSQFLANVSHELRTPLNGIHGLSQVLAAECDTAEQRKLVDAIQASTRSLMLAVDEILDFSKLERGELTVQHAPFDIRAVVEDAAAGAAPKAKARGLQFQTVVDPEVPRLILGDAQRLREILGYLLDNAVKFTTAGSVRLEAAVGGDPLDCRSVLFRVHDTGPGMQPELAAGFFAAFTQADGGSARAHGGLGLGLTIAHRLVGLMGGSMGVESQLGGGSVFWFLLPTRAADVRGPEPVLAAPGKSGRILVVDDNPINQLVAVRAVHSLGYAGDAVAGGDAALEAISRTRYDAVLMDCQMPGVDGFQAAAEIRRREAREGLRRVPIVAMTANGPGSDRDQCIAAGMDDYLAKPFRIAELGRTLERWIEARQKVSKAG